VTPTTEPIEFHMERFETDAVPADVLDGVKRLFAENYRDANLDYLEKNLGKLRYLGFARGPGGQPAGFALGEIRTFEVPRMGPTVVRLAGLCCVSPSFRRQKLFGRLENLAMVDPHDPIPALQLSCGRTAHPASFRNFFRNPAAVPHPGRKPTEWQMEVGTAVAAAYGSPGFDPETFVVKGSGVPIGWPLIEIEATPEEWEMFAAVDRTKGDSLLGIAWAPAPPPGWLES
jgi:hypothetical protein